MLSNFIIVFARAGFRTHYQERETYAFAIKFVMFFINFDLKNHKKENKTNWVFFLTKTSFTINPFISYFIVKC
jgi:hypothetical protein